MAYESEHCGLAFFTCQCKGVRFYGLAGKRLSYALNWRSKESLPMQSIPMLCVLMEEVDGRLIPLGHVAAEAAWWLSPILLGPYAVSW